MKKTNLTKGLFAVLLLASSVAGAESEYPAADFKPVIVYQDAEYIKKEGPAPKASAAAPTEQVSTSKNEQSGGLLEGNLPIVVIALAVVGIMVWNSKRGGSRVEEIDYAPAAPYVGGTEDETGVARYVKNVTAAEAEASKTGVSRYLEKVSDVPTPTEAAGSTGVAKYLQNRDAG